MSTMHFSSYFILFNNIASDICPYAVLNTTLTGAVPLEKNLLETALIYISKWNYFNHVYSCKRVLLELVCPLSEFFESRIVIGVMMH